MISIKEYLTDNGYTITMEEYKSYGSYFGAKKKFRDRNWLPEEIDLSISDLKDMENIYVAIGTKHYGGKCRGYVDKIEDIESIIKFMTNERKIKR